MVRGSAKRPSAAVAASDDDNESYQSAAKRVRHERHQDISNPRRESVRVKQEGHSSRQRRSESESEEDASSSQRGPEDFSEDEETDEDEEEDAERDQSDDEEDIDWTDQAENIAALQRVRNEKGRADLTVPQAGIIKSVRLVNFMNHKHFTFDNFGAKINFIVGHNGSGKSAILTAIATALGARASVTGRGSGVKDLIRRGADKATITVTLQNRGPLAYNPDKYPGSIVIERTFDKKGANTWKFKADRDGPVLETKKAELDGILSHFSINMDSPLTLLTQDMAKSFLANADEAKLYEFFLGGSSLKELSEKYEDAENKVKKMKRDVTDSWNSFPALKAKTEKYQRQVEAAEKRREMKDEMARIQGQLAWSYVIEREGQIADLRERLELETKKLAKYDEVLIALEAKRVELEDNIRRINDELETLNRERAPLRQQLTTLKREQTEKQRMKRQRQDVLQDAQGDIDGKKIEVKALAARIAARAAQNGSMADPREAKLRAEIKKVHDMRSNMLRQEPAARRKIPELQERLDQVKRAAAAAEGRREEVAGKLETARRQHANLSQQSSDPMAAYGTRMDIVLREINRARWREKPLGPLGQYVQLVDSRYKDIVHSLLGTAMVGFAVRYREDKDQLIRILKNALNQGYVPGFGAKQMPQIFMHKGDMFDFSAGDLSNRGRTILSVLKVNNQTALRVLVDLAGIERTFLSPDQDQAQDMINDLLDGGLPSVLVYSADVWKSQGRSHNSLRESGPQPHWKGNNLFVQDKAAAITALEEQVGVLVADRDALVQESRNCAVHVREVEKELADANRTLKTIENGLVQAGRKGDELADELARLQPEDGDALQEAKDEAEKSLEEMEEDRLKVEDEVKSLDTDLRKIEYDLTTVQDKESKFLPMCATKRDAIASQAEHQIQCQSDKEFRERSKNATAQKVQHEQETLRGLEAELQEWIDAASKLCERVELTETRPDMERRNEALQQSVMEADRRTDVNADEAVRKYNAAVKEYKELRTVCDLNSNLVKSIEKALHRRKDMWMMLRSHAATRVSIVFTYNLSTRGFEGTVTFDHEFGKLRLRVNTTTATSARGRTEYAKSANRLSGGERSYSTVCFLLALWETCPTTMACLDEWDVFLDSVNRQLAGRLIMEGAKDMVGKQFILITPLDMGGLQVGGEHNKVIRLGDPERGQGTLPI